MKKDDKRRKLLGDNDEKEARVARHCCWKPLSFTSYSGRSRTSVHLWWRRKMATKRRETQELESDSRKNERCVCLSLSAFPWGRKTRCSAYRKHHRKEKADGQIWNILFLAGVNALPALCVDVGERREKPVNCVYVLVHAVGENQVDAH